LRNRWRELGARAENGQPRLGRSARTSPSSTVQPSAKPVSVSSEQVGTVGTSPAEERPAERPSSGRGVFE
jgi:hypothetical protein